MASPAKDSDEYSFSVEKHMVAALYSGLISHIDTSDEGEDLGIFSDNKFGNNAGTVYNELDLLSRISWVSAI